MSGRIPEHDGPGLDHLAPHAERQRLSCRNVAAVLGYDAQGVQVADARIRVTRRDRAAPDLLLHSDDGAAESNVLADPAVLRVGFDAVDADRHAEAAPLDGLLHSSRSS